MTHTNSRGRFLLSFLEISVLAGQNFASQITSSISAKFSKKKNCLEAQEVHLDQTFAHW